MVRLRVVPKLLKYGVNLGDKRVAQTGGLEVVPSRSVEQIVFGCHGNGD
ncbi:MAG TPA: hypothetical protein VHC22_18060 [Pirellulales bacterium]|nr:hypothetical protein [Pirellulales bacterium]